MNRDEFGSSEDPLWYPVGHYSPYFTMFTYILHPNSLIFTYTPSGWFPLKKKKHDAARRIPKHPKSRSRPIFPHAIHDVGPHQQLFSRKHLAAGRVELIGTGRFLEVFCVSENGWKYGLYHVIMLYIYIYGIPQKDVNVNVGKSELNVAEVHVDVAFLAIFGESHGSRRCDRSRRSVHIWTVTDL